MLELHEFIFFKIITALRRWKIAENGYSAYSASFLTFISVLPNLLLINIILLKTISFEGAEYLPLLSIPAAALTFYLYINNRYEEIITKFNHYSKDSMKKIRIKVALYLAITYVIPITWIVIN